MRAWPSGKLDGVNEPKSASGAEGTDQRLESWGEIASYFGRTVRTVQRWEKQEGLPVHRHVHEKLSTVWVLRSELDAWSKRRQLSAASKPVPVSRSRTRFLIWAAAAIAIAAAIVLASRPAPLPFERILIQRMTSSGRVGVAAISPDGRLIAYADGDSGDQRLILKEVSPRDWHRPSRPGQMAGSRLCGSEPGRLYSACSTPRVANARFTKAAFRCSSTIRCGLPTGAAWPLRG